MSRQSEQKKDEPRKVHGDGGRSVFRRKLFRQCKWTKVATPSTNYTRTYIKSIGRRWAGAWQQKYRLTEIIRTALTPFKYRKQLRLRADRAVRRSTNKNKNKWRFTFFVSISDALRALFFGVLRWDFYAERKNRIYLNAICWTHSHSSPTHIHIDIFWAISATCTRCPKR